LLLGGLMLGAFVFRLVMAWREHDVLWDGYYYGLLGRNLIRGNFAEGLSAYWSPLYPLLVGVASLFFEDLKFAAAFVSVVAGTLTVAVVYLLAREFYGRGAAAVAGALAAVYPPLVLYSAVFLTEATYTLLFTGGILAGWLALRRASRRWHLFTGLAFGACYLVKPEAFAFVGLALAAGVAAGFVRRELKRRRTWVNLALVVAGFVLLSAPYLLYLRGQTGRWTLSAKTDMHLYGAVNIYALAPDGEGTLADRLWVGGRAGGQAPDGQTAGARPAGQTTAQGYANRPAGGAQLLERLPGNLRKEAATLLQVVPLALLLVALGGMLAPPWSKERAAKELYLSSFVVATLVGYALTTVVTESRLLVPVLPVLVLWWSRAVSVAEGWLPKRAGARGRGWVLRAALAALLAVPLVWLTVGALTRGPRSGQGRAEVGRWLKENSAPSPLIVAAGPWAAFYADGRHLFLPLESYPKVVEYARRKRVDYVVIEEDTMNPSLRFLMQPGGEQAAAGLAPAYRYERTPGHRIYVYRLTP
jgi:4-amino-4-deoxy-L-arabinose transferase-like glycosyltransferase